MISSQGTQADTVERWAVLFEFEIRIVIEQQVDATEGQLKPDLGSEENSSVLLERKLVFFNKWKTKTEVNKHTNHWIFAYKSHRHTHTPHTREQGNG